MGFPCLKCHRTFKRKSDLLRHHSVHISVKQYQCQGCGKLFSRKDTLANHIKTTCWASAITVQDSNVNPLSPKEGSVNKHICILCPRNFARPAELKRHLLVHLGLKPFGCHKCHKTFSRKESLSRHLSNNSCKAVVKNVQK